MKIHLPMFNLTLYFLQILQFQSRRLNSFSFHVVQNQFTVAKTS